MEKVYETVTCPLVTDSESRSSGTLAKDRKDALSCVAAVLSALTLLLLVIVIGTTAVIVLEMRRGAPVDVNTTTQISSNDYFACVPCIKLLHDAGGKVKDDPLLRQLTIEVHDGKEECCARGARQITALFESVARLNDVPDLPLQSSNLSEFRFSPVSAHKRLYPERISRDFGIIDFPPQPLLCEFKPDDARYGLEHHRGVGILKHGMGILYGGLYYVYISIKFRPMSLRPCREFKYQTFAAYVEKVTHRRSGSEMLLKVSNTCCDSCINTEDARFTGGIFILKRGDVIRVKVDSYEIAQFSIYSSFAGLAMLGNSNPQPLRLADVKANITRQHVSGDMRSDRILKIKMKTT